MKIAAVGNPNVILGLALAGVKKILQTTDPEEAMIFIDEVIEEGNFGIVMITSDLYLFLKSELNHRRNNYQLPLYIEFRPRGV